MPYWRTLKSGGEINEKYPGGIERQKLLLEAEGHRVLKKGRKYVVANFNESLYQL
jgi:alkylated DNA nucleotide flippase Atl1